MGQTHSSGAFFHEAAMKDHFASIQTLWSEEDLANLINRLKDMTLNFSLDRAKFVKLLQLSTAYEALVAKWFEEFSHDRASQVVDGLEFLSAAVMTSSKVPLFRKIVLMFYLFDLDKTGCIRKDEFTIFLKAVTTGLQRMLSGLPPPATVVDLGMLSSEFFASLSSQVLSQRDLLMWVTEAHFSLHYLSVLSRLGSATFTWGTNHRYQLGLHLEPQVQRAPAPVLALEGIRIAAVASSESHCLFLTEEGAVWTCGSGFCGLLGHGNVLDSPQPAIVDALAHNRIVDVAVGVRHSVAVSEKGQVFTWGEAHLGQLGHGSTEDREVHEWAYDPRTGGTFAYVTKPTVVTALFGRRILAKKAACCNFSTVVLTDQGHLYSWGNNTDGQCGQGQKCPEQKLIYVDPHMHRTAMQAIVLPKRVEVNMTFKSVSCGGYHCLAIDKDDRLWTWGQGLWGKLGHGDQRSMYEPCLVEALKHHICQATAAGESHSLCLISLCRLTITASKASSSFSPFSLLGLPQGMVERHAAKRRLATPPSTKLQLNAFASSKLRQLGLPFRHDPNQPIMPRDVQDRMDLESSVVLIDRALWEGEWLKLATSDFDFSLKLSSSGAQLPPKAGITGFLMSPEDGRWEAETDLADRICVFELSAITDASSQVELTPVILQLAAECLQGRALACLCILPKNVETFDAKGHGNLMSLPFGVLTHEHGTALRKHLARLANIRSSQAEGGLPQEVRDWKECRQEFTGKQYYEHADGRKRWAPPQVDPKAEASLLVIREDYFLQRLRGVLGLHPKGVVVCQQSWRPDVELLNFPEGTFTQEESEIPVAMVTYEAGEELKSVIANGTEPWITMEIQQSGGVCAWGNGTFGQLGLQGIENRNFLTSTQNSLTNEQNAFANRPYYVAHLHEHQVVDIACGSAHTVAVTQLGEAFTWGAAEGFGDASNNQASEVPTYVEQLEGLVKAKRAYAGHHHSFVVADMPFRSVI